MKSFGVQPYLFPMPVLMIATYSENDQVNMMNMAWGGICGENKVALNISAGHKTAQNLKARGAFTISVADVAHMEAADYLGTASGNQVPDKFARTGLTAVKSELVDAPVVTDFPVTLECKVASMAEQDGDLHVVGEIVNALAREDVLTNDKVDPAKVNALIFDQFQAGYYSIGQKVGQAWEAGLGLMK